MLNFIVNVQNCIKMSHYKLIFLEAISKGQVDIVEIADISQLGSAYREFCCMLNRLSICSENCRFIVCVPRTLNSEFVGFEPELYYRIMMKRLVADKLHDHGINCQVGLVIADYYKETIVYQQLLDSDCDISTKGHFNAGHTLPNFSSLDISDYSSFLSDPSEIIAVALDGIKNNCCKDFFAEMIYSAVEYQCDSDDMEMPASDDAKEHFIRSYEENFARRISEEYFWRFDVLHCEVNYSNQNDERKSILAIADYLMSCGESSTDFSQEMLQNHLDIRDRIASVYGKAMSELRYRFTDFTFSKYVPNTYTAIELETDTVHVNKIEDKLRACMDKCSAKINKKKFIRMLDGWPELYEQVRHSIRSAPEMVAQFSKEEVSRFSESLTAPGLSIIDTDESSSENSTIELAEIKENLIDSLSPEVESEDDGFMRQLAIDSQLNKTNRILSYLHSCSKFVSGKAFLKTAGFFCAAYILLYVCLQHKIVFSNTSGIITFFVTIGIASAVIFLSNALLNLWYRLRVMRLYSKLTKLVENYFNQYIERVKTFNRRLGNMRKLERIQQSIDGIQQEAENADDYGQRVGWHKRQITEYIDDALVYFAPIMTDSETKGIKRIPINVYCDDIGNEFYWLSIDRKDFIND